MLLRNIQVQHKIKKMKSWCNCHNFRLYLHIALSCAHGRDVYHFLKPTVMYRGIQYNNHYGIFLIFAITDVESLNSSSQYDPQLLSISLLFWILKKTVRVANCFLIVPQLVCVEVNSTVEEFYGNKAFPNHQYDNILAKQTPRIMIFAILVNAPQLISLYSQFV